jgi:asparagine synthase (glutamine-hydrolysing)
VCGIAGFTSRGGRPDRTVIEEAIRSIRHRGPDQEGCFVSGSIALGAVRLKILDLSGGDQPFFSEDGDTVVVFNGEIYNFRELRRELESRGHHFHTQCDTEVVLHAWLEWDTAAFERLRGMFAVAVWTESARRLVLARDPMGIKPLYYLRRGDDLHFASELKAILAHPAIERRIDPSGLSAFLSLNYIPQPHTLVAGIEKLRPGTWLEWQPGLLRQEAYWTLDFSPRTGITLEEAKEQLDGLLRESVREHLISDVPLGVWLSGGLDSSTIVHYAREAGATRLKTFSISFRGRGFDESRYFREVARAFDTDHHEFNLGPDEDLAGAIEQMAYYSDEPSADAGALPVWFLSRMTREHVTVALSGEGADELFGGYVTYLADRYAGYARLVPNALRRLALNAARGLPVSDEKIGFEYKLKRFLEGSLLDPVAAHLYWNGSCSPEQKQSLLGGLGSDPASMVPPLPNRCGEVNRFLYLDQLCYLPEDILYKCDRMSMAHSLEVRPPFLDHRMVEFAASLPERYKVRGRTLKFVLRELMRGKLPPAVLTRPKEGFDIPAHDWFRGPLRELLLDTVTEPAAREFGMLRWPAIDSLMRDHFDRRANAGYQLWGLLTLFLWIRRWKIKAPGEMRASSPIAVAS